MPSDDHMYTYHDTAGILTPPPSLPWPSVVWGKLWGQSERSNRIRRSEPSNCVTKVNFPPFSPPQFILGDITSCGRLRQLFFIISVGLGKKGRVE